MPTPSQSPLHWEADIPNQLSALMHAIEELSRQLELWGADDAGRYLAQLAVEELGTNILKYGYDDAGEHVIRLRAAPDRHLIRIELEDDGHEFNPCHAPEPDPNVSLDERRPGGWGISLIRRMLPEFHYERLDGRNVVRLGVPRAAAG